MRDKKLQLLVDDDAAYIVSLLPKYDKARFTELCIKEGFKNIEIRNKFLWNKEVGQVTDILNKNEVTEKKIDNIIRSERPVIDNNW